MHGGETPHWRKKKVRKIGLHLDKKGESRESSHDSLSAAPKDASSPQAKVK